MNSLKVIVKNELIRYFISPLAYVYLIAFLLLNGSFALYFGHFFERGQADLLPMFAYQPWLYLLFISGISMRSWAEEFRNKTVVQIVTMPVSVSQLVWGKFFAAWIFAGLALALTFPFWITVNVLGQPDNLVIAVGYLASFVLAGCMLSISQLMSALTKNQVIALVLAVVANLLFFLSGLEYVLAFFRLFAPLSLIDMIASFSFLTHFSTMSAGLIELRDVIFFISLILLFNFTTVLVVSFKTSGTSVLINSASRRYYIFIFILMLLGFSGLNLWANNWLRSLRLDFTQEKVFTLSDTSKKIAENLKRPIIAKLYYSRLLEERNPAVRQMFDRVRSLLAEISRLSDGQFSYQIYYPEVFSEKEDQAIAAGLLPMPVIDASQNTFFGLVLTDDVDNHQVIPFFAPERQMYLEQDIIEKIFALNHLKKTVGILTSLTMFDTLQSDTQVSQQWEIVSQIKEFFNVVHVTKPEDISNLDVLMIVHPRDLTPEMVAKIEEYTLGGGKLLVFADVAAEAERIYSPINNDLLASDFGDLTKLWGIQFHTEAVVADLDNSILVDVTDNYKTNPSFTQDLLQFILKGNNLNRYEPVTQNLKEIMMASATTVEPLVAAASRIEFVPLLTASMQSEVIPAFAAQESFPPEVILQKFAPDDKAKVLAAKVSSLDRSMPFELIAVADTDMLYDNFWAIQRTVLNTKYLVPLLDNANFVLNALEELTKGETLAGVRGKSELKRPFVEIEKQRKNNERDSRLKEAEIVQKINLSKQQIQNVWNKRDFEERVNFTPDELAIIANIRHKLDDLRAELSALKLSFNQDIKAVNLWVKFINIYAVPLLLIFIGGGVLLRRGRVKKVVLSQKLVLNSSARKLALLSFLLLVIGVYSVYQADKSPLAEYEDKLVFPNLTEQVNLVDRVVLTSHDAQLKFAKEDGIWKLDNPADVPVYQERIRSLLSALLNARFYEKKTADAALLYKFGLSPIEDASSPNIRIELQTSDGKNVVAFEVGKYDIDIGRGQRAAYIKFDDRFQVWLAAIDLIDIQPNWQDWTYDTLWNLRFGRLQSYNDVREPDRISMLMKELLNSYLEKQIEKPENLVSDFSLVLNGEKGIKVQLDFYKVGDESVLQYKVINDGGNNHLKNFAACANNRFYQVLAQDVEKIDYVLKRKRLSE